MFLVPPIPNSLKREKATVRDTCGWALCHQAFPQINHFNRELFGLVAERSAWSYKHNGAFDVWLKKYWLRKLDCVFMKVREATLDLGRWGLGGSERKTCGSIALPSISSRLHTLRSLRALYRAPTVHSQDCAQWLHCRVNWTLHWKQWIKCQRLVLCASRKEFLPHLPTLTLEPQKTRAPSCGNTIFSLPTLRSKRSKHFLASHTNNFSSLALWSFVYVSEKQQEQLKDHPVWTDIFVSSYFFLYKIEDIFADFRIFW